MDFLSIKPVYEPTKHIHIHIFKSHSLGLTLEHGAFECSGEKGGLVRNQVFVDIKSLPGIFSADNDRDERSVGVPWKGSALDTLVV